MTDHRRSPVFVLGVLALGAVAFGTVLAAFGRHAWVAELASHFPVHYLATAALVGAVGLLRRHYRIAAAAAVLAAPNAWLAAPYVIPTLVPTSIAEERNDAADVSLLSLNLFYINRDYAAVRDYLTGADADVLVLSEWTPAWAVELESVTRRYPHWMAMPRRTPWGLGVFSKYPLRDEQFVDLGVPGSVNVRAVLELPGRPVELIAAHLASPSSPQRAAFRNQQIEALEDLLGRRNDGARHIPRLLVGDLNMTPFSPYFRDLLAATGMEDARRPHGVLGTWPTWLPMAPIHIDHCIAEPALGVTEVSRGPPVGSDHYPLQITLRTAG